MTDIDIYNLEERQRKELAASIHIQIGSYKNRIAKGTITFLLDKSAVSFCGLDQMCMIMAEYLEQHPIFGEMLSYRNICPDIECESWQKYMQETPKHPMRGYPQKYAVRILASGNQSLQGELRVGNRRCHFRSGMELMRLMHQWLQMQYERPERQDGNMFSIL